MESGRLANVNHLATAHFWRLTFQKIEQSMWVTSVGEMLDVQAARGDEIDADDAGEDALLNAYGAREKELARRRRHVNDEYNKAFREERVRRQLPRKRPSWPRKPAASPTKTSRNPQIGQPPQPKPAVTPGVRFGNPRNTPETDL